MADPFAGTQFALSEQSDDPFSGTQFALPEQSDDPFAGTPFARSQFSAPTVPEEPVEGSGYGQDLIAAFGMGSNQLLSTLGNLYGLATGDMDNWAKNQGDSGVQYYKDLMSADYQESTEQRAKRVAEADGIFEEFAVGAWETLKDPRFLVEQFPMMVAPGGAGAATGRGVARVASQKAAQRAGVAAGVGSGAALQGSDIGGQTYEEIMALPDELWQKNSDYAGMVADGVDPDIAKSQIALDLSRQAAAASGTTSVATNVLPGARIFERAAAGVPGSRSFLGRVARGSVGEALQEGAEEGSGQLISNLAVGEVDPEREALANVGGAAGMGAAAGGPFGAIGGALQRPADDDADQDIRAAMDARIEEEEERRARGSAADQVASQAAYEAEVAGGDALDSMLAATEAYNEMEAAQREQDALAQQLDILAPGSVTAPESDITGAELGAVVPDAVPDVAVDAPVSVRSLPAEGLTLAIDEARAFGDEDKATRLENAQRVLETSSRLEASGQPEQAARFRRRADETLGQILGPPPSVPAVRTMEGEIETAEQIEGAPPPPREGVTITQERPALPPGGEVIYGETPPGQAERAARARTQNQLAMEGVIEPGAEPRSAAPLRDFATEVPAEEIEPTRADEPVSDSDYPNPLRAVFTVGDMDSRGTLPVIRDLEEDPEGVAEKRGLEMDVLTMPPSTYIERALELRSEANRTTTDHERKIREQNTEKIASIAKDIQAGVQFAAPSLDYSTGGFTQDGIHRAMAARDLGLRSIPVAVVREAANMQVSEPGVETPGDKVAARESAALRRLEGKIYTPSSDGAADTLADVVTADQAVRQLSKRLSVMDQLLRCVKS